MKLTAACAVLMLAAPAVAVSAEPKTAPPKVDASETWQVEGRVTAHGATIASTRPACVFQQQDGVLSGSCRGANSQGAIQGIVSGKHVRWTWRAVPFTPKTPPGATTFDGEFGADGAIAGMWTYSGLPGLTGRFVASRQKPAAP
jgi:hypothetical protein